MRCTRLSYLVVVLVVGLAVTGLASAQDVNVLASVEATTVGDDETVVYTVEVKGASLADVEAPEPPGTEGLVLEQPMPSTRRNVAYVNGRMEQSVGFQWRYRPVRRGTARILPATVVIGGEAYETAPIELAVVPQSQRPRRSAASRDPFGSLFGRPPGTAADDEAEGDDALAPKDLFIRAVPSQNEAFLNEQVNVEYRLYFRAGIQLRQSRLADSWDAEGFWREDLDVENRPIPSTTVEDGLRYNTITLKRVAVFPTHAGELTVDPLRIEAEALASRSSNDPFDRFFTRGRYQSIELASEPVEIEARPLPGGAPPSFGGAVGAFRMEADVSRTSVEVGEGVEVRVQVSGTGNLATLAAPTLEAPGAFERYDPQVDLNLNRSLPIVRGTKAFTYVLVPQEPGRYELPPIAFSYFDPETERYETLRSRPARIEVTGEAAPALARDAADRLPGGDLAGLLTGGGAWVPASETPLYRQAWPYAALLLPLLALAGLVAYRRHATRLETDPQYARSRRAHPTARAHLRQAEALLKEDRPRAFYASIERAVLGFVGDRMNLAPAGLTRQQLDGRLAEAGIGEADRAALHALLDECDRARFAPVRPEHAQMEAAQERAADLIVRLDGAFSQDPADLANASRPS